MVKGNGKQFPNYDQSVFLEPSPCEDCVPYLETRHDLTTIRALKSEDDLELALKRHLGLLTDDSEFDFLQN